MFLIKLAGEVYELHGWEPPSKKTEDVPSREESSQSRLLSGVAASKATQESNY